MKQIVLDNAFVNDLVEIGSNAGKAILKIYDSDFGYNIKKDSSPITEADLLSHNIIINGLKELTPDIPIISEESSEIPFNTRSKWSNYWCVDPLDGTKEFINQNGEFTVNIALIENNKPVFGLIHIPVRNESYWGTKKHGAFFIDKNSNKTAIRTSNKSAESIRIAVSRSHRDKKIDDLLRKIKNYELISIGSSLKFCLIAHGKADCYFRMGATSEWDTAAGHAIVKSAGGYLINFNGDELEYNTKLDFLNPSFICSGIKFEDLY